MLQSIRFTQKWRCFKQGELFSFVPGVNLLVGDQGCGKSSLIKVITECGSTPKKMDNVAKLQYNQPTRGLTFDFEHDNFRTRSALDDKFMRFHISCIFLSHGEAVQAVLNNLIKAENTTIILDEPDAALSIRSAKKLVETLKALTERGNQIIAAVHNPIVIEDFDVVLSIEHLKWMPSTAFISKHMTS